MPNHLYDVRLVLWSNTDGKVQYDDTGIRLSNGSHLSVAYSLVEQKMFGTLSRKHFGFASPVDTGLTNFLQMRVVPAYKLNYYPDRGVILGMSDDYPKRLRYIRAYNPASEESFRRLSLDLGRSNVSFARSLY